MTDAETALRHARTAERVARARAEAAGEIYREARDAVWADRALAATLDAKEATK